MKPLVFSLFIFLIITDLPAQEAGYAVISGFLLNNDGHPFERADITWVSNESRFPRHKIKSFDVDSTGFFEFSLKQPDLYRLWFSGPLHEKYELPLFINSEDTIRLEVRLSKTLTGTEVNDASFPILDASSETITFLEVHNDYLERSSRAKQYKLEQKEKGIPDYKIKYNWSRDVRDIQRSIRQEKNSFAKQALMMVLLQIDLEANWNIRDQHIFDNEFADSVFKTVQPNSPLWSYPATGFYRNLNAASEKKSSYNDLEAEFNDISNTAENYAGYVNALINSHPDSALKPSFYSSAVWWSFENNQFELFEKYFEELTSKYPETVYAERVEEAFRPNKNIQPGLPVPDFEFKNLENQNSLITRESLMGKTYLINFWATWCGPCMGKMEELHSLYEAFKENDFEIVNVSINFNENEVYDVQKNTWPMPWLNTHLENWGDENNELMKTFEVVGIPKVILVNKDGIVVSVYSETSDIIQYLSNR